MRAVRGELKMAIASVRTTKWRSLLTMLGIIIGIVSVVTVISIGEGVKRQIAGQLSNFGKDLITVVPGDVKSHANTNSFVAANFLSGASGQYTLTSQDARTVQKAEHVALAAPLGQVAGQVSADTRSPSGITVIGTSADLPKLINHPVPDGAFFKQDEQGENVAVIGRNVAHRLFREDVPLGLTFQFRNQTFIVRGIFDDFANVPLSPIANFDDTIFIPYAVAEKLGHNNVQTYAILAKPDAPARTADVIRTLNGALLAAHGNQHDFSVLTQEQVVASTSTVLDLITKLTTIMAAISVLVGGVGIMNVMLVSVTERMHEIGVRKAIGATSRQIWRQFMLEAGVLSGVGGVIGVAGSLVTSLLIRAYTDLKPVIAWQPMLIAVVVSFLAGVLFGTAPALKAARKDPIEALRHE